MGHEAYTYITAEMRKRIPRLDASVDTVNPTAWVKLFTPDSSWTWYILEYDGRDICYGYVIGLYAEFGGFSLRELATVRGKLGLKIERDLSFKPTPVKNLQTKHENL